jgi:hypothetical protein
MAHEPAWRVATYTGANGGDCVEVGDTDHAILIRDSKDRTGGTLTFTAATWQTFTNSLR